MFSQSKVEFEKPAISSKEFGVNATEFVNLFLSLNDIAPATDNYLFTYKKKKEGGKTFRLGLGLRGNTSVSKPDEFSNFDKRTVTFFDADLRMGSERSYPIKGNWSVNAGFDGKIGYAISKVNTDGDEIAQIAYYAGLGPIAGIQYMLNDRVGFLAEGAFDLRYSNSISKEHSDNNNFGDRKDRVYGIDYGISLPTNLIFFVRF